MNRNRTTWRVGGRGGRRRRRGQILVMALLAMTLMIGLIFYIYNVGDQINRRLALQSAADAAAIGGADWMARTMNLVAANNCAEARMLALVPIFDSAPLASTIAAAEMVAFEQGLGGQLDRGVPGDLDFLKTGIEELHEQYLRQREMLEAFRDAVNLPAYDMTRVTYWREPSEDSDKGQAPYGLMWRTAIGLQEFSQVALEWAGVLAQSNAVRFGQVNRGDVSFLLPVLPTVPHEQGAFTDFRPVLVGEFSWGQGCLDVDGRAVVYDHTPEVKIPSVDNFSLYRGGGIPDLKDFHRLGPFATLYDGPNDDHYYWRDTYMRICGGVWVPGTPGAPGTPPEIQGQTHGNSPVSGGASRVGRTAGATPGTEGHWEGGTTTVTYYTFGPMRVLLYGIRDFFADDVEDSGFYGVLARLTLAKLKYMFHYLEHDTPLTLESYQTLNWMYVDDYPAARAFASGSPDKVEQTCFYVLEIVSSVPKGDEDFLTPGTYVTNQDPDHSKVVPVRRTVSGWEDPATWNVPRIADYIWAESYRYAITYYPEIGIEPKQTPGGGEWDLEYQPVYVYAYYIWGGIAVRGQTQVIGNPCNWGIDEIEDLPKPWLYDTDDGRNDYNPDDPSPDHGARRRLFTFMGVVQRDVKTEVWPSRFRHLNPLDGMAAVAQAKVFNNRSWDLWTQNWRAELMPVTRWSPEVDFEATDDEEAGLDWMTRMEDGQDDLQEETGDLIDQRQYDDLLEYFDALDPYMAVEFLAH